MKYLGPYSTFHRTRYEAAYDDRERKWVVVDHWYPHSISFHATEWQAIRLAARMNQLERVDPGHL